MIKTKKNKWIQKLNRLLQIDAILVSPRTEIEAFANENFPFTVYVELATYWVNVHFENGVIESINDSTYFKENVNTEEKLKILKEYIYEDSIERFNELLEERNLELHKSEKANELFIDLIDKISYTQIIRLCYSVARFFSDKVLTGQMIRKVACNAALLNVSKFYENAIESGWDLQHADYEYAGIELKYYVEKILGKKLKLLQMVPSIDAIEKADDIEKDYNSKTKNSNT